MAFDVGAVVAHIKADVSNFQKGIKQATELTSGFSGKLQQVTDGIANFGKKAALVAGAAAAGFGLFLKSSVDEANQFNKAMTTLDIIAGRFGVSGQEAQDAAKQLGEELRIGVGPAAESLQNLLKAGLGLDEARDMLKRFTNEAITGKSSSITLSQAVENLSFAYATNNSMLGNLSGISENFNDIIKRGEEALLEEGVAAADITEEMAKYKGMIELTNLTMGSAERFTGTYIDKQALLQQKLIELKTNIGLIAIEVLTPFIEKFAIWLESLSTWVTENEETIRAWAEKAAAMIGMVLGFIEKFVKFLIDNKEYVIAFFIVIGGAIMFWVGTLIAANAAVILVIAILVGLIGWVIKAAGEIRTFAENVIDRFNAIVASITAGFDLILAWWNRMITDIKEFGQKLLEAIMWPFNEAKRKIEEIVGWIKDKLDFTKRQSPSIMDIINRSVRLANESLDNLNLGVDVNNRSIVGAGAPTPGGLIANVTIDMSGAYISSELVADEIGERMGDSLIRRLQQHVRF